MFKGKGKGKGRSMGRRAPRIQLNLKSGEPIDYKNLQLIQKCIGAQGQIVSRRRTGLSAQNQRLLKQAIKRARHLALLPFIG